MCIRDRYGSDVDFGSLTRHLIQSIESRSQFKLNRHTEVKNFKHLDNGHWQVRLMDTKTKKSKIIEAKFVFLGAGGGALKLLQKTGVPESHGYGGFPVSGQWLVCKKPEVIMQHACKAVSYTHLDVYKRQEQGSLDLRPGCLHLGHVPLGEVGDLESHVNVSDRQRGLQHHIFGCLLYTSRCV